MKVDKIPISTVCTGIYDGPHATPPESEIGAIFLGIPNFKNGRLDFSNVRYISEQDLPQWVRRVTPRANDIVFSYEATLHLYAIIPEGFRGCLGRRMALLRIDEHKAHYKYLFYYFQSKLWRETISHNLVLGSTVDRIPLIKFPSFPIVVPSLPLQRRIAFILSVYDELIEKNNRKITILQEQVQELYKEWFVRMHFPGHNNVKVENGLPEGWEKGRIEKLCVFARGKNITANEMQDGLIPVISAGIEPSGYHNSANVCGVSITVSSSGANAGFVSIHYSDIWASDCSFVNNHDNIYYVYELLNSIRPSIFNLQRGAAQPHVYPKDLNHLKLIIPDEKLQLRFNAVAEKIHSTIAILIEENENVTRQRDLLLPRLMSGKLEVH